MPCLFEELLDLGFGFCFFFCGFGGQVGGGGEAGVGVEEGVSLAPGQYAAKAGVLWYMATCASRDRVCCRSCTHPLPVEMDMFFLFDSSAYSTDSMC